MKYLKNIYKTKRKYIIDASKTEKKNLWKLLNTYETHLYLPTWYDLHFHCIQTELKLTDAFHKSINN